MAAARMPAVSRLATRGGTLEYVISGGGRPAIVLCSGAGVTLAGWHTLYPAIERMGTVFAWNRFGDAGSDAAVSPQTGIGIAGTLRELLKHAGVEPPYVLVGHSFGGLHVNLFARMHPHDVAAVMLLESAHPDDPRVSAAVGLQLAASLARRQGLPPEAISGNLQAEIGGAGITSRAIEAAGEFPQVPLTVISGGIAPPESLMPADVAARKRRHQFRLAQLSKGARHVIAERSGHFPQWSEPRLVLDELASLVQRVKIPA